MSLICPNIELEDPKSEEEDFYNKEKTRNCYNTSNNSYNCMGYALGTFSWICPYEKDCSDEREEYIEDLYYRNDFNCDVVANILLEEYKDWILEHFSNVRVCKRKDIFNTKKDEYAIAMKTYVGVNDFWDCDEDSEELDFDFHFVKYENEEWSDKPGSNPIKYRSYGQWDSSEGFTYNSKTLYFIVNKV